MLQKVSISFSSPQIKNIFVSLFQWCKHKQYVVLLMSFKETFLYASAEISIAREGRSMSRCSLLPGNKDARSVLQIMFHWVSSEDADMTRALSSFKSHGPTAAFITVITRSFTRKYHHNIHHTTSDSPSWCVMRFPCSRLSFYSQRRRIDVARASELKKQMAHTILWTKRGVENMRFCNACYRFKINQINKSTNNGITYYYSKLPLNVLLYRQILYFYIPILPRCFAVVSVVHRATSHGTLTLPYILLSIFKTENLSVIMDPATAA